MKNTNQKLKSFLNKKHYYIHISVLKALIIKRLFLSGAVFFSPYFLKIIKRKTATRTARTAAETI